MKGLKFISVLLLISISILIGHNLVPHHHHMAMKNHPSSHECPAGDHVHHEKDSGSKHCHAFNNIIFVKYNHSQLPTPVGLSSFVLITNPGQVTNAQTATTSILHPCQNPIVLSAEHPGNHSLRGPPVLS